MGSLPFPERLACVERRGLLPWGFVGAAAANETAHGHAPSPPCAGEKGVEVEGVVHLVILTQGRSGPIMGLLRGRASRLAQEHRRRHDHRSAG